MTELAAAYVQIIPSMKGVTPNLKKELSGAIGGMETVVSKHASGWGNQIKSTLGASFKAVAGMGATAFAAVGAAITANLGAAVSRVDTLNNFPRQMQNMGYTAAEAEVSIKKLSDGITGLPTTLDGIVGTAQSLAPLTGSLARATDLSLALNNAFLASGRGAAEASRGMAQITQMFASGAVDMMSWRTLMETMPGQLNQLAKSMLGPSANAQTLYSALQSGQVSMRDFQDAIIDLNKNGGEGFASFAEQAKSATNGIATSFMNARTALTRGMANIIQAIGPEKFTAIAAGISAAINDISSVIVGFISSTDFSALTGSLSGMLPVIGGVAGALGGLASHIPIIGQFLTGLSGPVGIVIGLFAGMVTGSESLQAALVGAFTQISSAVGGLAPLFTQVFGVLTTTLGGLGDALAPVVTLISGVLVQAIQLLTPVLTQMVTIVGNFVAQIMPVVTSMIQSLIPPIMQIVQTVLPPVAALLQQLMPIIGQVAGIIGQVAAAIAPLISQLVGMLVPAIQNLMPVVSAVLSNIMGIIEPALSTIQAVISTVMAVVSGDWSGAWEGIKGIVSGVLGVIKGVISGVLGTIKSIFSSAWNALSGVVTSAWDGIRNGVSSGISKVVSLVTSLPGKILDVLGNLGSLLVDSGRALLEGLWDGINGAVGWVKDQISGVLDSIRNLFPFSPAKEGPFSGKGWVLYSGLSIGDAMAEGISRSAPAAVSAARALSTLTREALNTMNIRPSLGGAVKVPDMYGSGRFDSLHQQGMTTITVNVRPEDLAGIRTVEDFVANARRWAVMQGV